MSETSYSDVHDNGVAHQYELVIGDEIAFAAYKQQDDVLIFTHTIVPTELEGRGVGTKLIAAALADARAKGLRVRPLCSFVAGYIERHPETSDLLEH